MPLVLLLACHLPDADVVDTDAPDAPSMPPPELRPDDTGFDPASAAWCYLAAVDPQGPQIASLDEADLSTGVVTWIGVSNQGALPAPAANALSFDGERFLFGGDPAEPAWWAWTRDGVQGIHRLGGGASPATIAAVDDGYVVAAGDTAVRFEDYEALKAQTSAGSFPIDRGERVAGGDDGPWLLRADAAAIREVDIDGAELRRVPLDPPLGAPLAFSVAGADAVVLYEGARLARYDLLTGRLLSQVQLTTDAWTSAKPWRSLWCSTERWSWSGGDGIDEGAPYVTPY